MLGMLKSFGGIEALSKGVRQQAANKVYGKGGKGMVKVTLNGLGKLEGIDLTDNARKISPDTLVSLISEAHAEAYAQLPFANLDDLESKINQVAKDAPSGPLSGLGSFFKSS